MPCLCPALSSFHERQPADRTLEILAHELAQLLGEKLSRIILYGSYARCEASYDSDLDILIVLNSQFDYAILIHQTSELVSRFSLEYDVVISRAFLSKDRLETEFLPFTMNIQREGVPI